MYEIHKQSRFPKNKFQSQFYRSMSHPVSYYVISSLESFIYINFSSNLELETVQLESYEFHWAFIGAPSLSLQPLRPFQQYENGCFLEEQWRDETKWHGSVRQVTRAENARR